MFRRKFIAAAALAGLFLAPAAGIAGDFPKGSPEFKTSYEAALKAGKEASKPVLLVFSASWCPPCQANKKNVYPDATVKPYHDKFIWAYLDADDKANTDAMKKYGVSGIPHIQFLDKDGASVGSVTGGTSPSAFTGELDKILKKVAK